MVFYCISSVVARENQPLAMLAILKARCKSDCSSSTWPHFLAVVADVLNSYRKFVADWNNEMRLLPQPYTHP
jgi:hypothetical protein